mmetsp:Transcript_1052/g.2289  ORF Transcript_1052/g.2289 Transcript_1052/m.2289 type:complete len:558 (+) Transcript_1052:252-1925(+)
MTMPVVDVKDEGFLDKDVFGTSLNDFDPFAEEEDGNGDEDVFGGTTGFGAFDDDTEELKDGGSKSSGFGDFVDFGSSGSSEEDEEFFKSASSFGDIDMTGDDEKPRSCQSLGGQQNRRKCRGKKISSVKTPCQTTKDLIGSIETLTTAQSEGSVGSGGSSKHRSGSKSPGSLSRRKGSRKTHTTGDAEESGDEPRASSRSPGSLSRRKSSSRRSHSGSDSSLNTEDIGHEGRAGSRSPGSLSRRKSSSRRSHSGSDSSLNTDEIGHEGRSGSKSPGPHSRRSVQRSRSGSDKANVAAVSSDEGGQIESGEDDLARKPPIRRRSHRRASLCEVDLIPPRSRPNRSRGSDGLDAGLADNDEDEEIQIISASANRRGGLTSNQRPSSSKRLVSNNARGASIRNLFSDNVKTSTEADSKSTGSDEKKETTVEDCTVKLCHSVVQRPSGRRGNLSRNFSGLKAHTKDDHGPTRSIARTASMNRKPPSRASSSNAGHRRQSSRNLILSSETKAVEKSEGHKDVSSPVRPVRRSPTKTKSMDVGLSRRSLLERQRSTKKKDSKE